MLERLEGGDQALRFEDLLHEFAAGRRPPEERAEAEKIRGCVCSSAKLLGGRVAGCPRDERAGGALGERGDAKIDELYLEAPLVMHAEHDVVRRDVPVDDVLAVDRLKNGRKLKEDLGELADRHRAVPEPREAGAERLAVDVFHRDRGEFIGGLAEGVDRAQAGVPNARSCSNFRSKSRTNLRAKRAADRRRVGDLDDGEAVDPGLLGQVGGAEGALAKDAHEAEPIEFDATESFGPPHGALRGGRREGEGKETGDDIAGLLRLSAGPRKGLRTGKHRYSEVLVL